MSDFKMMFWHWWILAAILMMIEVLMPGAFFLWIGIAAASVGGLSFFFPSLDLSYQIFILAISSLVTVWAGRSYLRKYPSLTDQPNLNRRGEQYIGDILTLSQPIVNRQGTIKVDDSIWKISGDDCPEGTQVCIKGVYRGNILEVEIIESSD